MLFSMGNTKFNYFFLILGYFFIFFHFQMNALLQVYLFLYKVVLFFHKMYLERINKKKIETKTERALLKCYIKNKLCENICKTKRKINIKCCYFILIWKFFFLPCNVFFNKYCKYKHPFCPKNNRNTTFK